MIIEINLYLCKKLNYEAMKLLKTYPHLTDSELKRKLLNQTIVRAYKDWQIIYSVQTNYGVKSDKLSSMLGVTKYRIYHVIQSYNKHGVNWRTYDNWGGRREEICNMSIDEEKSILERLEKDALSGKILIYKHIKSIVEDKLGRSVSDDYIWDLFKRHNWSKKTPIQSHPNSNIDEQEEFKKNSKRFWQPNN